MGHLYVGGLICNRRDQGNGYRNGFWR